MVLYVSVATHGHPPSRKQKQVVRDINLLHLRRRRRQLGLVEQRQWERQGGVLGGGVEREEVVRRPIPCIRARGRGPNNNRNRRTAAVSELQPTRRRNARNRIADPQHAIEIASERTYLEAP